jgi:hypothetical protein
MFTDTDYLAWREHYKDLRREAAQQQLISAIQPNRPGLAKRFGNWFSWPTTIGSLKIPTEARGETILHG